MLSDLWSPIDREVYVGNEDEATDSFQELLFSLGTQELISCELPPPFASADSSELLDDSQENDSVDVDEGGTRIYIFFIAG